MCALTILILVCLYITSVCIELTSTHRKESQNVRAYIVLNILEFLITCSIGIAAIFIGRHLVQSTEESYSDTDIFSSKRELIGVHSEYEGEALSNSEYSLQTVSFDHDLVSKNELSESSFVDWNDQQQNWKFYMKLRAFYMHYIVMGITLIMLTLLTNCVTPYLKIVGLRQTAIVNCLIDELTLIGLLQMGYFIQKVRP